MLRVAAGRSVLSSSVGDATIESVADHRQWLADLSPAPSHDGRARLVFRLPASGAVSFEIYDARGRRIAHRDDAMLEAGTHEVTWDTGVTTPGAYFIRFTAPAGDAIVKRWMIVR